MPLLYPHLENRVWFNIDNELFYWVEDDLVWCSPNLEDYISNSAWSAIQLEHNIKPDCDYCYFIEV